ncbi:type IV pilus modification PilV family protein [Planctomicrobium sp. SH661]|uniref:type IV pilus modification PilV family protein n=1 Tax=Planctomicrobium sp. SH661 TaxID=3448124 RepID=UPI003F5C6FED
MRNNWRHEERRSALANHRSGMSLLEVLLAGAILIVSLAALAHPAAVAVKASLRAEQTAIASMLAVECLNGILSGSLDSSSNPQPSKSFPDYSWQSTIQPAEQENCVRLTVMIHAANQHDAAPVFQLSQVVRASRDNFFMNGTSQFSEKKSSASMFTDESWRLMSRGEGTQR